MIKTMLSIFKPKTVYVSPQRKAVDCSLKNETHSALAGLNPSQVEYVPTPREKL